MNQDELMHFGVKGMRWGVRKARPSSGTSGGKKPTKAKLTRAQKKEIRARDTTTTTKVEEAAANLLATTILRANQRMKARNETLERVTEKAEKSIRGVAMAKVPGRLEFMRARVTASHVDNKGATVADNYRIMYFNAGKTIKSMAVLGVVAGTAAFTYRV